MIPEHIASRKGPRRLEDMSPEVLEYLNSGLIETANMIEWLAVDQVALLKHVLNSIDQPQWLDPIKKELAKEKKLTANSSLKIIGRTLGNLIDSNEIEERFSTHTSDVVRCWIAHHIGQKDRDIKAKLNDIKRYAADRHFGVREVSFMAVKESIAKDLNEAIEFLAAWTSDGDENIRRFTAESTRPIGVWTVKIDALKENPQKGLPILDPLKSDSSKYVRDAVANWLNDASKSQPMWVEEVCSRWQQESDTKETAYTVKRALRTIEKKKV